MVKISMIDIKMEYLILTLMVIHFLIWLPFAIKDSKESIKELNKRLNK